MQRFGVRRCVEDSKASGQKPHVSRTLPARKTWVKQLLAGQMGLTVMAALYGMIIGVPLGASSSSWDATSQHGLARLHKDMAAEDPYLTVITHSCGPWGIGPSST